MENFDVIVIGSGPGGHVAALKAAKRGKSVAVRNLVTRLQLLSVPNWVAYV